MGQPC